jgi:hypothetical protein
VGLGATSTRTGVTIAGTGSRTLAVGANSFNVVVTSPEDGTSTTYVVSIYRKSDVTNLATLAVTSTPQGTLSPTFNPAVTSYTYTVDALATSATVSATPPTGVTILVGTGIFAIADGSVLTVLTQSEDGNTTVYTITVSAPYTIGADATLSDLTIGGVQVSGFAPTTMSYNYTVPNGVTSLVALVATPTDSKATVVVTGNSGFTVAGPNTVTITVTAEDGTTTAIYTINVTVTPPVNAELATLSVTSTPAGTLAPTFVATTSVYTYTVDAAATSATVVAAPATGATIISGTGTFAIANNTVLSVVVQSSDGIVSVYRITIDSPTTTPVNAELADLVVTTTPAGTLAPTFVATTTDYVYTVDPVASSATVVATPATGNSIIAGNGTYSISDGLVHNVVVQSTSGDLTIYKVIFALVPCTPGVDCPAIITSDTFGHDMDSEYIFSVAQYVTADVLKTQFDNPVANLELWNAGDTAQLPGTTKAMTGQILKLMVSGVEVDRKIVVVRGDANGDGEIDTTDLSLVLNHANDYIYVSKPSAFYHAADANGDGEVDTTDLSLVLNHANDYIYIHPQS